MQASAPVLSRRHALALGAAGFAFGLKPARAADYQRSWTFGDVTVSRVVEMSAPYPADKAFPGAALEAFDENPWLVPHFYDPKVKGVIFTYQAWIVRTPKMVLLMDGGFGEAMPKERPGMTAESFLDNLKAAKVAPDQVNYAMNSHFHSDHIGWNTRRDGDKRVPMWGKARYLFDRTEVEFFAKAAAAGQPMGASFNVSIKPVIDAGVADLIDGDRDLGDGVRILALPGHTPGHHGVAIDSKGKRAVLCGDLFHSPIEIVHPEWDVVFDYDKNEGRKARNKFLDQYTDVDVTIFAAHFGGPTAGKIVSEKGGKRVFKTLVP